MGRDIWTIGHWTCPEQTFLGLIAGPGIEVIADVRAHPGSRASPQFGTDAMRGWLDRAGVGYVHLPELGGRRRKQDVDPILNAGWEQPSFKNYADYTLQPAYEDGIARLVDIGGRQRTAYLCSEPMPWRCHRLLISNTLTVRGWTVRHIMGTGPPREHELGRWGAEPALDPDGRLTYPRA